MPLDLRPRTAAFCRWHGTACQMGARWPIDPPEPNPQDQQLWQLIREARGEPEPDPEQAHTRWFIDRHEPVAAKRQKAELAELHQHLAEAKARNVRRLQEITDRQEANRSAH